MEVRKTFCISVFRSLELSCCTAALLMHCLAKLRADIAERENSLLLSTASCLLRCVEEIWPPENQSFQAPMHQGAAAHGGGGAITAPHRGGGAATSSSTHSSSAFVQASLPKNNGARGSRDPYVIVGGVQHWKTKPRAHSAAAQAIRFFAVSP